MTDTPAGARSLDGRRFARAESSDVLECREQAGIVWGSYSRADAHLGLVLGTRTGDVIDLRCCHVDDAGATTSTISAAVELLDDGRLRLRGDASFDEVAAR